MAKFRFLILSVLFLTGIFTGLHARYTLVNGTLINTELVLYLTVDEHYKLGCEAYEAGDWAEAARHFKIVTFNAYDQPMGQDGFYYLGVSLYNLEEYDIANEALTDYIKLQTHPRMFEDAMLYKYYIAEAFRYGACRRFYGTKRLPKWASGKNLAIKIYDEVIHGMPGHDYAAYSAYSKGLLQKEMGDYRSSVDSFHSVIRRFPKHELAPESYIAISGVYLEQTQMESQNPDILSLAQINLRRYTQDFPRDPRVDFVQDQVQQIKEEYARGFYETGRFYERVYQPEASMIYYNTAINTFPDTQIAECCRYRIECLQEEMAAPAACPAWNTAG